MNCDKRQILRMPFLGVALLNLVVPSLVFGVTPKQDVVIHGVKAKVWASSELASSKDSGAYAPKNTFDGNLATAWVEGAVGAGKGEWIEVELEQQKPILGVVIWPGYLKNTKSLQENAAPRRMDIKIDGRLVASSVVPYRLSEEYYFGGNPKMDGLEVACLPSEDSVNLSPRLLLFPKMVLGKNVRFGVSDISLGTKYKDMAISDISLVFGDSLSEGVLGNVIRQTIGVSLRDTDLVAKLKSSKMTDLRKMTVFWGGQEDEWIYADRDVQGQKSKLSPGKIMPTPRTKCKASAIQCWMNLLDSTVITQFSTLSPIIGGYALIGKSGLIVGDGAWIDLYPVLEFDKDGQLVTFKEYANFGGDPGCYDLIPARHESRRNGVH